MEKYIIFQLQLVQVNFINHMCWNPCQTIDRAASRAAKLPLYRLDDVVEPLPLQLREPAPLQERRDLHELLDHFPQPVLVLKRLLEQLEVGPVLTLAPAVAGSQQDVGDVVLRLLGNSELWPLLAARGAVALADAIHDLGCGPLDDVAGVCLSYPDVECLTKRLESLLLHGV